VCCRGQVLMRGNACVCGRITIWVSVLGQHSLRRRDATVTVWCQCGEGQHETRELAACNIDLSYFLHEDQCL
jgi:hypothetical protein